MALRIWHQNKIVHGHFAEAIKLHKQNHKYGLFKHRATDTGILMATRLKSGSARASVLCGLYFFFSESEHHNNPKFRVSDIRNQVRFLATGQWRHQQKEASVHQVIVGRGVVEQGRFWELDLMSCWDGAATAQGIESLKPRMKIKHCAVLPEPW